MRFADLSRGRAFAKDPSVVNVGGHYLMYYSLTSYGDGRDGDGWAIGIAKSDDLEHWEKIGEIAPETEGERTGVAAPGVLILGDTIHLFYQTYGNGARDAICHAVSTDGLTFRRDPTNPVFAPSGAWTNGRAIDADAVAYGGFVYLYAATRDPSGTIQQLCVATARQDSALGRGDWTQASDAPILRPELDWEQDCIEAPAVLVRRGRFHMFYAGAYNNAPQQIGHAVSADGIRWTRASDQPFLTNGPPGSWNACESGHPGVFVDGDRTHLFYQGNDDDGKTWHLSRVEIGWTPDDLPILIPSAAVI